MAPEEQAHNTLYAQFCGPRLENLASSIKDLSIEVHNRVDDMDVRLRPVEIKVSNGFDTRMRSVEKMQWWLLGAIGGLGGLMITLHLIV